MERRQFIKVMATGSTVALLPVVLTSCGNQSDLIKKIQVQQQDVRLTLISHGMLAPNPHNIQPWLIDLIDDDAFDLYVDQTRLLPETDPPARQIHIGQGTFLEGFRIAAAEFGYRSDILLFPEGMYGNTVVESKPVARVKIAKSKSLSKDPLFKWMFKRQSNKRVYGEKSIGTEQLKRLMDPFQGENYGVGYTNAANTCQKLAKQLKEAMVIETSGPDRHKESVDMFRFTEAEVLQTKDGFTIANSGLTGFKRWLVETLFLGTRQESESIDSAFAKEGIKLTGDQAASAAAFSWISSKTNDRLDQVKVGQIYMRANLEATKAGIAMHPMSQILEEYSEMQQLQQAFKKGINISQAETVQMLFRLGYADPVPHTLRRHPNQILSS